MVFTDEILAKSLLADPSGRTGGAVGGVDDREGPGCTNGAVCAARFRLSRTSPTACTVTAFSLTGGREGDRERGREGEREVGEGECKNQYRRAQLSCLWLYIALRQSLLLYKRLLVIQH